MTAREGSPSISSAAAEASPPPRSSKRLLLTRNRKSTTSTITSGTSDTDSIPSSHVYSASRKRLFVVGLGLVVSLCVCQLEVEWRNNKLDQQLSRAIASLKNYTSSGSASSTTRGSTNTVTRRKKTTSSTKSTHKIPNLTAYNQHHFADTPILDLLEWEETSRITLQGQNATHLDASLNHKSCQPPNGIPNICCLGSYSAGGGLNPMFRHECAHALTNATGSQWELLKSEVHKFYQDNPISTTKNNPLSLQCDICQIVELAKQHSLQIALVGDSMHSQVAGGLQCELQRRGYILEVTTSNIPKSQLSYHLYMDIKSPTWPNYPATRPVRMAYHMLYRFPLKSQHAQTKWAEILGESQVLFLGMGLHWRHGHGEDRPEWPHHMGTMLQEALYGTNVTSSVELVVERETSAQHFDVDGGDWASWMHLVGTKQPTTIHCVNRLGEATYWRERDLENSTIQAKYGFERIMAGPSMPPPQQHGTKRHVVVAVPYHNFTQLFHRMHPIGKGDSRDCTHYCSSPFLYMTLWRSLRLAMDWKYQNQ